MRRLGSALLILSLVLQLSAVIASEPRVDPETQVIRLLHIGKAWYQSNAPGPVFVQDPKINWIPVPAHAWSMGSAEAFRALRLYLPRSKEQFFANYDVVLIDGMDASHLRMDFQYWLLEGVTTKGMNFVMADDSSSFATSGTHTSWYLVPVGEILPVDGKPVGGSPYGPREAFRIIPEIPNHEFTNNIPWNEVWIEGANRPWPKLGSTVVTRMSEEVAINRGKKQMVYWDYPTGNGRSVAWVQRWVGNPEFWRWRYSTDVTAHVIYFTARVPIPTDLNLIHRIRGMIGDYYYGRLYASSTMEFADKFGANIRPVEVKLLEMGEQKARADRLFIEQDYEGAALEMEGALAELDRIVQEAILAKDRALTWIFLIEWFVVSGTSMLAGAVVWTLMVKRRLYREVGETRLRATGDTVR